MQSHQEIILAEGQIKIIQHSLGQSLILSSLLKQRSLLPSINLLYFY